MRERNYEVMGKGEKEARIGLDSEKEIIDFINTDNEFEKWLRDALCVLGFFPTKRIEARKNQIKSDIILSISEQEEIGVSIKSSTKTSFHHLDRRTLDTWRKILAMPSEIYSIIRDAILRVSRNSRNQFILEKDRAKVGAFLVTNIQSIITTIFQGNEPNLKLLLINNKDTRRLFLLRMDEVLSFLIGDARDNFSFSRKGIAYLGNFISMQRKGGNGSHIKIPKTNWQHPGNQLQFKFSPLKFAEEAAQIKEVKFVQKEY